VPQTATSTDYSAQPPDEVAGGRKRRGTLSIWAPPELAARLTCGLNTAIQAFQKRNR
jgi:hypothetical protein